PRWPTRMTCYPPEKGKNHGIYVLDVRAQQVVKLTHRGNLMWVWGTRGDGPGEVQRIRAMSATPDGVVVADSDNQRLLWVDSVGRLQREARIRAQSRSTVGSIEGIATLKSGYVLEATGTLWPILLATGEQQSSARPFWPILGKMPSLQRIGMVTGTGEDEWVFSFLYGNGWIRFKGDMPLAAHPFVEHSDFPRLVVEKRREGLMTVTSTRHQKRPRRMTSDVKSAGDTLLVLSATGRGRRVIDKYDMLSGEYWYSQELPGASKIAVAGDRIVVIDNSGLTPTIRSYQVTRRPR
ncbi:MAG: hypothetical protein OXK74_13215, partial [Gemmatimonadota bacterium]|nr:hypothetical protein [Gemmatimonadota bacterium]